MRMTCLRRPATGTYSAQSTISLLRSSPNREWSDSALAAALSDRERQVFERLVVGASNAEIGDELVITVETVKTHVKRILRKIGAINRSEAIALYMEARTGSLRHSR